MLTYSFHLVQNHCCWFGHDVSWITYNQHGCICIYFLDLDSFYTVLVAIGMGYFSGAEKQTKEDFQCSRYTLVQA